MHITNEQLKGIIGNIYDDNKTTQIVNSLNETFDKYHINNILRVCHFLAQILHESGAFKYTSENLNYSAQGLMKTFPKYFPTLEIANQYAKNPQKIANKVYANRMGNGDENSGDGWKYRGRGNIQTTGKSNYQLLTESFKIDFVNHPEYLEQQLYSTISAGWFWNSRSLNQYADQDNILTITKKINGGTNGLEDRKLWLIKCKNIIK
jgi:putative chitinase